MHLGTDVRLGVVVGRGVRLSAVSSGALWLPAVAGAALGAHWVAGRLAGESGTALSWLIHAGHTLQAAEQCCRVLLLCTEPTVLLQPCQLQ